MLMLFVEARTTSSKWSPFMSTTQSPPVRPKMLEGVKVTMPSTGATGSTNSNRKEKPVEVQLLSKAMR